MSAARACSACAASWPRFSTSSRRKLRVLTGNVGGSFGMKAQAYPEYVCLLHAARLLSRPVKWTDERSSSFLSDSHGRDHEKVAELALDAEGRFLAIRLTGTANMGAYLAPSRRCRRPSTPSRTSSAIYRTPLIEVSAQCVFTNTSPVGAYRGAGRPEANYFMERLIDTAARRDGHRPAGAAPAQPHQARGDCPTPRRPAQTYDSGDFPARAREGAGRLPTGRASPSASARARSTACCAASRHRQLSRSDGAAEQGDGRHPFRARRRP